MPKYNIPYQAVKRMRIARMQMDIRSDAELARRLGVAPQYLNDILRGRHKSKPLLRKIARLLNIPESEICDD